MKALFSIRLPNSFISHIVACQKEIEQGSSLRASSVNAIIIRL